MLLCNSLTVVYSDIGQPKIANAIERQSYFFLEKASRLVYLFDKTESKDL